MILPSNPELARILRDVMGEHVIMQGTPESMAEEMLTMIRTALAATQEQPDNYNSKLADDLQRLCCAETEGKFFDCITDNIQTIIAALRSTPPAHFDGEKALAEWEGKHGGGK